MPASEPLRFDDAFIEELIFGGAEARRFTQDSPILPDVWTLFCRRPGEPADLLLTPHIRASAGTIGLSLREALTAYRKALRTRGTKAPDTRALETRAQEPRPREEPDVAYNRYSIAVRLYFDELVRIVLPMTSWWRRQSRDERATYVEYLGKSANRRELARLLERLFRRSDDGLVRDEALEGKEALSQEEQEQLEQTIRRLNVPRELLWMAHVVGALLWAQEHRDDELCLDPGCTERVLRRPTFSEIVEALAAPVRSWRHKIEVPGPAADDSIWQVNRNRRAFTSIASSVLSVKGDAARQLFDISCSSITWAILDTGIDATHPAFFGRQPSSAEADAASAAARAAAELEAQEATKGQAPAAVTAPERPWWEQSRVRRTYDFTRIRFLLNPNNLRPDNPTFPPYLREALRDPEVRDEFRFLKAFLNKGRQINWGLLEPFLRVPHDASYLADKRIPIDSHGTHVAGILGARGDETVGRDRHGAGMCPDIELYDFRVLGGERDDEFSIISALQFINYLNAHKDYLVIHGVNVSLSIPHQVNAFACGSTPACEEAERLMSSGVVVVCAAGNYGYQEYKTVSGVVGGYMALSITDPGNAERVITVGSTHRSSPHAYGVSYFSSRGPTGDGRFKPDLVAPGEKIEGPVPHAGWEVKDGTSQATPHVSGAAALLMARHGELVGRSRRIKEILCETATDLGRERYFQGHGMVDVLRALQSV